MELTVSPLLFYLIIALIMLGAFVIGFLFGTIKPMQTSSKMAKELQQMVAKVLEVEQKLNAVQQRVEISAPKSTGKLESVPSMELSTNITVPNEDDISTKTLKEPSKPSESQKDDLQKIAGIGPFLEEKLNNIGYYSYQQLSELTDDDTASIAKQLNLFSGRIHRDEWVDQAKELVAKKMQKSNA